MNKFKDDEFFNFPFIKANINTENIRLLSQLAQDAKCPYPIFEFAAKNANIETEALMRHTAEQGEHHLIYNISEGDYYDKEDLDIAIRLCKTKNRYKHEQYNSYRRDSSGSGNQREQTYNKKAENYRYNNGSFWYDYYSDGFIDEEMKERIKNIFRERYKAKSNYNNEQHAYSNSYSYHEQNTDSSASSQKSPVKWTRAQFLEHINGVLFSRKFKTYMLKDSEVRNLAKLLGTTEEQIKNMNKAEYTKLALKYHPDRAEDKDLFSIINTLYKNK